MEVTPEIYSWLINLKIFAPFKSTSDYTEINFLIPEKTLYLLFGGKYMDIILKNLQDAYNKFYKFNTNYLSNIKKLRPIKDDQEYISNSIKYENWKIIIEILNNFGLSYSEKDINLLVNNSKEQLNKIITTLYNLISQFLKHSNDDINNNLKTNLNKINNKSPLKGAKNNKSNLKKNYDQTKFKIEKKDNNENIIKNNIFIKKNLSNFTNIFKEKKIKTKPININEFDPSKSYKECTTPLDFFILSICKNMKMKPRQSVALLSNNRKYLSIICHKGFNNEFSVIKKWLTDLYNNRDIMIKLLQKFDDGNICFGIIGTALCSQDEDICLQAAQLLKIIKNNIGMNWEWLFNEGINSFIFILSKIEKNKLELLKILYDFIKEDTSYFFGEIKERYETEKKRIMKFLSNIINIVNNLNSNFCLEFQNIIFELCLKEKNDRSFSLSMLSDTLFSFYPIHEELFNKMLSYFKECIRGNSQNAFSTGIFQFFILIEKFGKIKYKYAPQFYKNLVFVFLENYDNEMKREIVLEGFEKFFNNNHNVPIDILLEPYLNQLNACQNYALCDFLFLFKMVEHPRIESKDLNDIIQFLLNACLNNNLYRKSSNLIISLIFEKKLIENIYKDSNDISEVENKFVDFINSALDSYITNLEKEEDKNILETPYDIIVRNFSNVNMQVKDSLIKSIKDFRKLKGTHSNSLLAMLWNYDDTDDIILQIEELNRPIYEPMDEVYERQRKEQEEKDSKNFTKKLIRNLSIIQEKKINMLNNKKLLNEQKKLKEEIIKRRLEKRRTIERVMSGKEISIRPILFSSSKFKRNNSNLFNMNKQKISLNYNIKTKKLINNKKFTIKNDNINKKSKDVFKENSKLSSNLSSMEFNSQGLKLRKNNSQLNMITNKNNDDIYKKFEYIKSNNKKHIYNETEKEYKLYQQQELSKILIQKEGKYINIGPNGSQIYLRNGYFIGKICQDRVRGLPYSLKYEEDRELKAINGYNRKYAKNIRYYFNCYENELKKVITKKKFMKMMRDKGIKSDKLDYDEINIIIRRLFKGNLNEFSFSQFNDLLIQTSYLIYTKQRKSFTISETYGFLLKRLSLNKNIEKIELLKRKYKKVIDYLLELKENKESFNMPEGFKFITNTIVKYNNRLAPHFLEILGEGKFICYQILEDIIFKIFNVSIIEPYVKVYSEETVDIEPEKLHNWTPDLTLAFIDLDKKYKFEGFFAADILEEGLRKIVKKHKINDINENNENRKSNHKVNMALVTKKIIERIEEYKRKKIENKLKKKPEKINKVSKEERKEIISKFRKLEKKLKRKEEEKIREEERKEEEKVKEKIKTSFIMKEINKERFNEVKMQLETIAQKRNNAIKERKENELIIKFKAKQNSFEKTLKNTMKELLNRCDIKDLFQIFSEHLKFIYDMYKKMNGNKISLFSKEFVKFEEFKHFLIHFQILEEIISKEQMVWIFANIANQDKKEMDKEVIKNKENKKEMEIDNELYFDFDDFKLSLIYLSIFYKIKQKNRKIIKSDLEEVNVENIKNFMEYLNLKIPFNQIEIEKFINEKITKSISNEIGVKHKIKRINRNENDLKKISKTKNEDNKIKTDKRVNSKKEKNKIINKKISQKQIKINESNNSGKVNINNLEKNKEDNNINSNNVQNIKEESNKNSEIPDNEKNNSSPKDSLNENNNMNITDNNNNSKNSEKENKSLNQEKISKKSENEKKSNMEINNNSENEKNNINELNHVDSKNSEEEKNSKNQINNGASEDSENEKKSNQKDLINEKENDSNIEGNEKNSINQINNDNSKNSENNDNQVNNNQDNKDKSEKEEEKEKQKDENEEEDEEEEEEDDNEEES